MSNPVDIRPDHLKTVQGILREHLPMGVKVWVFGSRAHWTTKDSSDLDIALEGEGKLSYKLLGSLEDAFEDSALPYTVDIVDLNQISKRFRRIVEAQKAPFMMDTASQNEWQIATLGDCVVVNDATYAPKEAWSFVNYLDTGNITENRICKIQNIVIGEQALPSRARRKVRLGDIVYSTVRPNQRHFGLIKDMPENFLVSTGFAVIRGKPETVCTEFVYWFLVQDYIVKYLHSIAENSTSAYPSIRPNDLKQLELLLPPLSEQRRIAAILGALDDKIELNQQMNETLEQMTYALYKSWFVDFDPVRAKMDGRWERGHSLPGLPAELYDLFPDRLVASELGEIPKGWEVNTIGDLATVEGGFYPKHENC